METRRLSATTLRNINHGLYSDVSDYRISPYNSHYGILRDAPRDHAWEQFGTPSLPVYFARGIDKFSDSLEEFSNLSKPLTKEMEKQLLFMIDSLLYVRKVIAELEDSA